MPNDISSHRTNIGIFYTRAIRNHKLPYLDCISTAYAYMLLSISCRNVSSALIIFFFLRNDNFFTNILQPRHTSTSDITSNSTHTKQNPFTSSIISHIKILLSGDVEQNPGPNCNASNSSKIVHINCRSLSPDKKLLIEAESDNFDISKNR